MSLELAAGLAGPGMPGPGGVGVIGSEPGGARPDGALATPGENDVQRFQAALEGPKDSTPAAETAPVNVTDKAMPPSDPSSSGMGDRILREMSEVSNRIQAGRETAAQALVKPNVSQADLLRANFAMIESSTLVSAVSKTTEKITQGLKTLQQG